LIRRGKIFSLNLLDKSDQRIIRTLEKPFRAIGNKLSEVSHVEEEAGAPILPPRVCLCGMQGPADL
jgi:hypothetical protein